MKSDIELLGVEDYLRDNADRIIRSLNLIFIGMSRDTPLGLCGHVCGVGYLGMPLSRRVIFVG